MTQYIKIGKKVFPVEEVCERLSVEPSKGLHLAVGHMSTTGNALETSVTLGDPDDLPCVETWFCPQDESPVLLSHTEEDVYEKDENGRPIVRTFLYDRAESYVGYLTHKTCPEGELGDEKLQTTLVASGDGDVVVNVYRENQHVNWCGPLPRT